LIVFHCFGVIFTIKIKKIGISVFLSNKLPWKKNAGMLLALLVMIVSVAAIHHGQRMIVFLRGEKIFGRKSR